jgi:hypothetical protein
VGSFRFRRSVKIAPGLKINFNKKSVSLTAGRRGAHVTKSFGGRSNYSVGVPGTGLWYRGYTERGRKGARSGSGQTLGQTLATAPEGTFRAKVGNFFMWVGGLVWILPVAFIVALIAGGLHNFGVAYLVAALLWTAICTSASFARHKRIRVRNRPFVNSAPLDPFVSPVAPLPPSPESTAEESRLPSPPPSGD